jgi:hypothetical protein
MSGGISVIIISNHVTGLKALESEIKTLISYRILNNKKFRPNW